MRNKSVDLEKVAAGLDISPSLHKYAIERYNGIASFLDKKGIKAKRKYLNHLTKALTIVFEKYLNRK